MPIIEIDNFNLALLTERVDFGSWRDPAAPNLVDAEVEMATAVDSHEHDVILGIFLALRVQMFPMRQLILTGLSIEDVVEVIVEFRAWRVQVDEDSHLFLIKEKVVNLVFFLELDDCRRCQELILTVPLADSVASVDQGDPSCRSEQISEPTSLVFPVLAACIKWPLKERS